MYAGSMLPELAKQKESSCYGAVPHCISIPPKLGFLGFITDLARNFRGRRNFTGESFWARGYFVSTVGLDEEMVRKYIRDQEKEDSGPAAGPARSWGARSPPLGGS